MKKALVAVVLLGAGGTVGVVSASGGFETHASVEKASPPSSAMAGHQALSRSPVIRESVLPTRRAHSAQARKDVRGAAVRTRLSLSGPSAGVRELAQEAGVNIASLEPLLTTGGAHPAVVFGTDRGAETCAYLSRGGGAVGGCMRLSGVITPRVSVVDGGTYIWGLAAKAVTRVEVRVDAEERSAPIVDELFAIELPDGSHGTGAMEVLVTSGTTTTRMSLPGIPKPVAPGS